MNQEVEPGGSSVKAGPGRMLGQLRLERKLSIADVAQRLKYGVRQIEAHAVLESLRDIGDRQLTLEAQLREHASGPGFDGRSAGFNFLIHSNRPFCSSWYSFDPGKRRRSWLA